MKSNIFGALAVASAMVFSAQAYANDLFMGVEQSTGSATIIMNIHSEELSDRYNTEIVVTGHCSESTMVPRLEESGQKGMISRFSRHFSTALAGITAEFDECMRMPNEENFVYGHAGFGVLYTLNDSGISVDDFFDSSNQLTIGLNGNDTYAWMNMILEHHDLDHRVVRYENSSGVLAGAMSREVDVAYTNSNQSFWANIEDLSGLFSSNPNGDTLGEVTIPALNELSDFHSPNLGSSQVFLAINLTPEELDELRNELRTDLMNPDSEISQYYADGVNQINTLREFDNHDEALAFIMNVIDTGKQMLK